MGSFRTERRTGAATLRHRARGLTLIELMITVAVMAVLIALAAPSFRTLLMNSRMSSQADGLYSALNYARSTALASSMQVDVCPIGATDTSTTCGEDWGAGWMVVSYPAEAPLGVLVQSARAAPAAPVVSLEAGSGPPTPARVTFNSRGLATNQSDFKVCDSRGADYARSLWVLPTGFVQAGLVPGQAIWGGALACPAAETSR
jgi:type IV fimbrial biogenesis protein FimT